MIKELVLNLRAKNFAVVKQLLADNPIYLRSDEDLDWMNCNLSGDEDTDQDFKSTLDIEYILMKSIHDHVKTPDLIHAFLIAGLSPFSLARCFVGDPYRLMILYKLLPIISASALAAMEKIVNHEKAKQEALEIAGEIDPMTGQKALEIADEISSYADAEGKYKVLEHVRFDLPVFPIIFEGITSEFSYAYGCYENSNKFAFAEYHEMDWNSGFFALEVHDYLCDLLKQRGISPISKEHGAYIRQNNMPEVSAPIEVCAEILAVLVVLPFLFFAIRSLSAEVAASRHYNAQFAFDPAVYTFFGICICATLNICKNTIESKRDVLRNAYTYVDTYTSTLWLKYFERFDFASRSENLVEDLRVRHKPYVDEHKCPKELLFWHKLFINKNEDMSTTNEINFQPCKVTAINQEAGTGEYIEPPAAAPRPY